MPIKPILCLVFIIIFLPSCSNVNKYYIKNWETLSLEAIGMLTSESLCSRGKQDSINSVFIGKVRYLEYVNVFPFGVEEKYDARALEYWINKSKTSNDILEIPKNLAEACGCDWVQDENYLIFDKPTFYYYFTPLLKSSDKEKNIYSIFLMTKELRKDNSVNVNAEATHVEGYEEYGYKYQVDKADYFLSKDTIYFVSGEIVDLGEMLLQPIFPFKDMFTIRDYSKSKHNQ